MEPKRQEIIEQDETAPRHETEKLFRPTKKQAIAAIRKGRDFCEEPARGVNQDPQKNLPKGGAYVDRTRKVLSFTYITPQGKFGRFEQLVDAKISKEDLAAVMDKKAKGGRIINAFLLPYAPKA